MKIIIVGWTNGKYLHISSSFLLFAGPIPVGYRYEAQRQSESSHGVPVEGFELACKDYRHVLQSLERFLTAKEGDVPLVFSKVRIMAPKFSPLHSHLLMDSSYTR